MSELFLASNFYTVSSMVSEILHHKQRGKKTLYITTAAEGEEGDKTWLDDDRNALQKIGLESTDYTVTGKTQEDFAKDFKDIQYILVSGGNVFYLLEKAQQSGFISFISQYMRDNDVVYCGSSAGAAVAGADIYPLQALDDPKKAPDLKGNKGFGFVDLCLLPHWGSENFKDRYLNGGLVHAYGDKYKLVLLTNNQFLHVDENGAYRILEI